MKITKLAILFSAIGLVVLTGCTTAIVRPHVSEDEFPASKPKIAGSAELYVSEGFRTYRNTKLDPMDAKKWQFELGSVAVDTFKYALKSRFDRVYEKAEAPSFPLPTGNDGNVLVVIKPSFSSFSSHCPYFFKFETYVVKVSFRVKAYDPSGKALLDKVYQGTGKKRGSVGLSSAGHAANPIAAKRAVKDAVNKAIADILAAIKKE